MNTRPPSRRLAPALLCLLLACGGLSASAMAGDAKPALPPLAAEGQQHPGKFVWADLVTDDVPAARKFYGHLFGWKFRNYGDYRIATNAGQPVAGLISRSRPKDQPGQPRWIGYFSVASVAVAQDAVVAAGGRVLAPRQDFPRRGAQAVFADAEGAVFGVITSTAGDPEDCLADPGDWIWMQLLTGDIQKAATFYRAVGGYGVVENTLSGRADSRLLTSGGYARAALRAIPPEAPQVKPTWLPFVRVENVVTAVARVRELGGKVLLAPAPELFAGRVAVIADPSGAALGLLEWTAAMAKGDPTP